MYDLKYKLAFPFRRIYYSVLDSIYDVLDDSYPKGQIVFGLGTGRSGTNSLATLLNMQNRARVWHEKEKWRIPWYGGEAKVKNQINYFKVLSRKYDLVGDISFYYLPYVPLIIDAIPGVKFICMQRDKQETVVSYIKWVSRQNFCPWIEHDGTKWQFNHWDHCYPKYSVNTMEEAVALYYDDYYKVAGQYAKKYPDNFKIFSIDALNTETGQLDILHFLGVKNPVLKIGLKTNVNPEK